MPLNHQTDFPDDVLPTPNDSAQVQVPLMPTPDRLGEIKRFRDEFSRFMLNYQFGLDEILTKINILKTEFEHSNEYSPIEHVTSRLKSPESILEKVHRRGIAMSLPAIQDEILDIAGVRIVCSFIKDAYAIADMLSAQTDITVLQVKDYIARPKPNGYKSLHLIVEVPVFLSSGVEHVRVELQIRTIAMDFWASLEHKIYYKFEQEIPGNMLEGLMEAAEIAGQLDVTMERIHDEIHSPGTSAKSSIQLPTLETFERLFGGTPES